MVSTFIQLCLSIKLFMSHLFLRYLPPLNIALSRSYWVSFSFYVTSHPLCSRMVFSIYPAGTISISFSNTLFSYAKYNFPSIQFQRLSIVGPVSLCKVFYCRKLIRYCSFVFILIYALYVPGML